MNCSKTCVKSPLSKNPQICFQHQLLLNAGQKYCTMLQGEHSAILLTYIKLPFVTKIFVLSIFEWPFYCSLVFIWPVQSTRRSIAVIPVISVCVHVHAFPSCWITVLKSLYLDNHLTESFYLENGCLEGCSVFPLD